MCNPVTYHIVDWISDCSSFFSVLLPLSAQLLTLFTKLHTFSLRLKQASATCMLQVYVAAGVLGMAPDMDCIEVSDGCMQAVLCVNTAQCNANAALCGGAAGVCAAACAHE